jgi:hypothetical protein|nr:MAG TPA: hypothetical protein [Caudoviricetes sp.]
MVSPPKKLQRVFTTEFGCFTIKASNIGYYKFIRRKQK